MPSSSYTSENSSRGAISSNLNASAIRILSRTQPGRAEHILTSPAKGAPNALRTARSSVPLRRARAAHRRRDDADPPRHAPQGLRRQRECRPRRNRVGHRRGGAGTRRPRGDPPRRQAENGPKQRRRPREPHLLLADHEPRRRRRADRRPEEGDRRPVGQHRRAEEGRERRRRQALRQRLDVARVGRERSRPLLDAEPGFTAPPGRRAAARHRRLGARVLPQVPEQATGLSGGLVERRELGRGGTAIRRGARVVGLARPAQPRYRVTMIWRLVPATYPAPACPCGRTTRRNERPLASRSANVARELLFRNTRFATVQLPKARLRCTTT